MRLNITSLLALNEASYALDGSPGAANAILLSGRPTLTPMEMTSVERDVMRSYFGNSEILPSSIFGRLELQVEAAGSGTPGVAPAWGPLHRGCAMSETILAAPVTGTAQEGDANSITLAAGASAVDDLYSGMPLAITAGTGNGKSGYIVDYNGTTKVATIVSADWVAPDATSEYSIGACVAYRPISEEPESLMLYMNVDGVLHKFLGARGNVSSAFVLDQIPVFRYQFSGLYVPVTDAPVPAGLFTQWKQPRVVNNDNTPFFSLHGYHEAGLESLEMDQGNEVSYDNFINAEEEFVISNMRPSGSLSIKATTVAEKDWWDIASAATLGPCVLQHGTVAGNRVALSMPAVQIAAPNYGAKNNTATFRATLRPQPVSGGDDLTYVAF